LAESLSDFYTRTGDDGYTGLIGKEHVPKYDLHPTAYGEVDELQAVLGRCRAAPISQRGRQLLVAVERDLYVIMAGLATTAEVELSQPPISAERVAWLEAATEELGRDLPPLNDFLLPGDTSVGALVNLARTVARRAERAVVRLAHEQGERGGQTLYALFPKGPAKKVTRISGLGKPTGCI
jgi:cob(I)alamin adenosyltransferase